MSGDMYKLRILDLVYLFFLCFFVLVLFQIRFQGYVHFFKSLGRIKSRIMHDSESGVLQMSERVRV
jgi:hypothetical protein